MRTITVYMSDGDTITTGINGTDEEILKYYLGSRFTLSCETRYHVALLVHFHDTDRKAGLRVKNIENGWTGFIADVRAETVQVDDEKSFEEIFVKTRNGHEYALNDVWVFGREGHWIKGIGYKHPAAN